MKLPIIIIVCCSLIACTDKYRVPDDIINKNEMQQILWDMVQADQYSAQFLRKDSAKNLTVETLKLYDTVFAIHHISADQFKKSFDYYLSRPDITKIIFDSLASEANRRRNETYLPVPKIDTGDGRPTKAVNIRNLKDLRKHL